MRLNLSAAVRRQRVRRAYRGAPWNRFGEAEVADIRSHLTNSLGIGNNDLCAVMNRRGRIRVEVSDYFMERVAAWQLWTYRTSNHVVFGRLLLQNRLRGVLILGVGTGACQQPYRDHCSTKNVGLFQIERSGIASMQSHCLDSPGFGPIVTHCS